MAWVALDDRFPNHPKINALSDAEFRAWACALAFSQAYRTRGHIPATSLTSIPRATPRVAQALVDAGLWHANGDGWVIHDFDDYNPERIRARESARLRQEAKRERDAGVADA